MASFDSNESKTLVPPKAKLSLTHGRLTNLIGTGKNAKHSIALIVLLWVFIAGGATTLIIVSDYWWFTKDCNHTQSMASEIKLIWELVTPIVTLVLGYEFGRNEK